MNAIPFDQIVSLCSMAIAFLALIGATLARTKDDTKEAQASHMISQFNQTTLNEIKVTVNKIDDKLGDMEHRVTVLERDQKTLFNNIEQIEQDMHMFKSGNID